MLLLRGADRVEYAPRVPVRRVDDQHVHARADERCRALLPVEGGSDGRADAEPPVPDEPPPADEPEPVVPPALPLALAPLVPAYAT
jgi:hypothetical protein